MRCLIHLLLFIWIDVALATSFEGSRLLIILNNEAEKGKYSKLFTHLESQGFNPSFKSPSDKNLSLFRLGERVCDHVLIFPTESGGLGPHLTTQSLIDFINSEGNIVAVLSAENVVPPELISLLSELGIYVPTDRKTIVVDHFNYDTHSSPEKHDTLLIPAPRSIDSGLRGYLEGGESVAVPRAIGQILDSSSPLVMPVLQASTSAYSYDAREESDIVEEPFGTGRQLTLVSAMQARNSARIAVLGSASMIEDSWFDAKVKSKNSDSKRTGNFDFIRKVFGWTYKEFGVLKSGGITHFLKEHEGNFSTNSSHEAHKVNPKIYRTKDELTVQIEVSEFSNDRLEPYILPTNDNIQVEVAMLSPFYRLHLEQSSQTTNSTVYTTSLALPDQHGIYNIRVNYKRPFYTNLDEKVTVTVRHFAHNEWPRSFNISGAWVWVAGIWVTIISWLGFLLIWLYSVIG